jgi:acyl carrier protein
MTSNTRKAEVYAVISSVLGVPPEKLSDDSGPGMIENWDSLSHINLVLAIEEHFAVVFTDDDVTDMLSVGLICRILRERLDAGDRGGMVAGG